MGRFLVKVFAKARASRISDFFILAGLDDDMVGFEFRGAGSFPAEDEFLELVVGDRLPDDRQHSGEKGDVDVDFRKTEEAAVGLHETEIAGAGHDGPVAEGVSVDGGDDRHRIEEDALEDPVQTVHEVPDSLQIVLRHGARHPLEIDPLRPVLRIAGGDDHRRDPRIPFDFVECRQKGADKIGVVSVFAVVHRDDADRFHLFPFDYGHRRDLLGMG